MFIALLLLITVIGLTLYMGYVIVKGFMTGQAKMPNMQRAYLGSGAPRKPIFFADRKINPKGFWVVMFLDFVLFAFLVGMLIWLLYTDYLYIS